MDIKRNHLTPEDFFFQGGARDCRKWDDISKRSQQQQALAAVLAGRPEWHASITRRKMFFLHVDEKDIKQ